MKDVFYEIGTEIFDYIGEKINMFVFKLEEIISIIMD
jgi:hypothetical protein